MLTLLNLISSLYQHIFCCFLSGFAVDTGMNLMKQGELNVVAGAPRSNHSGEVLLLRPEEKAESTNLKAEYILQGPGLASSFGYDLAVLDLNGDGWVFT